MRWQTKSTLLIVAIAPLVAGLILQVIVCLPQWSSGTSEPNQVSSFVFTFVLLTIPLSYVFGVIPSAIAGAVYCGILSRLPTVREQRWLRTIPAAVTGGLVGAVFGQLFSDAAMAYASLCAGVAVLLAIFIPRLARGTV